MKCLVALEAKQGEATKYHAMQALVVTPSHSGHGGEMGITRRLVSVQFCYCMIFVHIQLFKSNCIIECTTCSRLVSMSTCPRE
jgi:hypothetical protein